MFSSSTTFIPAQYLKLIQVHQRELRAEAERLALVTQHQRDAKIRDRGKHHTAGGVIARLRTAIAHG